MSWFNRAPRPKAPPHHVPKNFSPATERSLQEAKLRAVIEDPALKKKIKQG